MFIEVKEEKNNFNLTEIMSDDEGKKQAWWKFHFGLTKLSLRFIVQISEMKLDYS